ncbi:hypothetical protein LCGC14_3101700 [marine sediment metagenome]|uniref:Uncharacterized protein n=1 Tax=marine sediment metagenome TaxID=412755 RepID=A0A0F8W7H9_9ZZZZ
MSWTRKTSRRRRKNTNKTEVQYKGTYKFIPELKMQVKIKEGSTIKEWIEDYCKTNPDLRVILYPAYNIKFKKKK